MAGPMLEIPSLKSAHIKPDAPLRASHVHQHIQEIASPFTPSQPLRASSRVIICHKEIDTYPIVRPQPFSEADINSIFGPSSRISPEIGNRIISVLQSRRVDGTLDLDLPPDILLAARPRIVDAGLKWLRENYPLDEDAAIMARIEREEKQEQDKLVRRAEALGLYKPQSGTYQAELGDSNDPSGRSVLQEAREQNEARLLAEQERKRQEWLEGGHEQLEQVQRSIQNNTALQKFDNSAALEVRERADPKERPMLAWIQRRHIGATVWDIDLSKLTNTDRILRGLLAVVITTGLSYLFAQYYQPVASADRMWPDVPPAAATISVILGVNIGIAILWRSPSAWKILNRYFMTNAAIPQPLSFFGSVFSHQSPRHLFVNMIGLWFIGTKVHDEIGRGQFLSLYATTGVFAAFTSVAFNLLLKGNLAYCALGASGAISGLVAAMCMIHSEDRLTLIFLPDELKEVFWAKGSTFLATIVAVEVLCVLVPRYAPGRIDYIAHLGGYLAGYLWSIAYKKAEKERRQQKSWFGVATTAAQAAPRPAFKLKKSWNEIKVLRNGLENGDFSLVEGPLDQTEEIIQTETVHDPHDYVSDLESDVESVASDDSLHPQIQKRVDGLSTYIVSHPWKIVDYHLYLCSVERDKDTHSRRNGMCVYDGIDCRPVTYHELFQENAFEPSNVGENPQFLFVALPIADTGPIFRGRHYVLGFDYNNKALFARYFDWIPTKTDDIWSVWDYGFNMYSVPIADLLNLMDSSLSESVHVNLGFLSSSPYCMALGANDDPGLEIVIAVLFCQWMLDFADAILQPDRETLERYKERISAAMDECRIILQRASYRAWFASRDGYTKSKYVRNASVNKFISDLYTFDKSTDVGSLNGQPWRAPGLDTCNILRHNERMQRKVQTEQRLKNLFTIPEINYPYESQGQVIDELPAEAKESPITSPLCHPYESRSFRSPSSAKAHPYVCVKPLTSTTPRAMAGQNAVVTDYQSIPVSFLLKRTLQIIDAWPELDTLNNRSHVGALLTEIQDEIVQAGPHPSGLSYFDDDDNDWKLGPKTALASRFVHRSVIN
ncbi:hypothetical protein FE257_010177 [Aspergillus nanangensis]|uniref:Peptidase S54 rhomboid domain-containing protein n=1 Tax=Aspergillus nanangensis TaxID=2582783 RepID=A0AAD4CJ47_ASPNN|nr:hypothetical protein FE257_010177 [Aspergillus nanangensis]